MSVGSASMSEEEDDDELPAISVNSSSVDMSMFVMPSADVLASQRAREEECEREILALRSEDAQQNGISAGTGVALTLSRSDSSGSEGEALAAAVNAMLVKPAAVDVLPPTAAPAHVALLRRLPDSSGLLANYLNLLEGDSRHLNTVLYDMVSGVTGMLSCEATVWSDEDVVTCGAWLAGCGAAGGAGGGGARRALHRLLDARATIPQVTLLGDTLLAAAAGAEEAESAARALMELSDAVRSGARAVADQLAARLVQAALEMPARDRDPGAQYTRVQLAGRALGAAHSPAERARLLAALPAPPRSAAAPAACLMPDYLKVVVGAAKLQLLFGERGASAGAGAGAGAGSATNSVV